VRAINSYKFNSADFQGRRERFSMTPWLATTDDYDASGATTDHDDDDCIRQTTIKVPWVLAFRCGLLRMFRLTMFEDGTSKCNQLPQV